MFIIFQHKLKGAQRDKVRHFIQITNAPEKVAVRLLNQHDWKLELAIDDFYFCPELTSNASNHQERRVTVDRRKVEQLFNKYRGEFLPNTFLCLLCILLILLFSTGNFLLIASLFHFCRVMGLLLFVNRNQLASMSFCRAILSLQWSLSYWFKLEI